MVSGSAESIAVRVSVPLLTGRAAVAISQFCDVTAVSPRGPPCRSNVRKNAPSKAVAHVRSCADAAATPSSQTMNVRRAKSPEARNARDPVAVHRVRQQEAGLAERVVSAGIGDHLGRGWKVAQLIA